MEFRMLGPLHVDRDGGSMGIRGRHHPKVLALLLDEANRVVSVDRLIEALWDESPPATASQQINNVISRLRRQLEPEEARLQRIGRGYRLAVGTGESDLLRSKAAAAKARELRRSGRPREALEAFGRALDEWSGPSLAGLSGGLVESIAHRLDEFRLSLLEERIDLDLALGRHAEAAAELHRLVSDHPVRQRFAEQLMLALYRSGRAPEALEVFAETGERLAEAFGIDPGRPLRDLHVAILREDPALNAPPRGESLEEHRSSAEPVPDDLPVTVPAMLPAAICGFTGRAEALKALDEKLGEADDGAGLAVITGTGGIGKTTLALHWVHQVAERFPDGRLHLDMRGYDPHNPSLTVAEAIRTLLEALGVPPARIPSGEAAQVGLYRSLVANRRLLVVLDNARSAAQIRPLLPGGPDSFTLVTSRDQMTGLTATQGVRPVNLRLFDDDEAHELLEHRLGKQRLSDEPEAVDRTIAACNGLPLALAITAARFAANPDAPLGALVDDLVESGDGLDPFTDDDPLTDLRSVFGCSYRELSPAGARMFRLLGLHPGPRICTSVSASLAAVPVQRARTLLRELTAAHLLTEPEPGRYAFHDLLRLYAAERARAEDDAAERAAALDRAFAVYRQAANETQRLIDPDRDCELLEAPHAPHATNIFATREQATAWFTEDYEILLGMARMAARDRLEGHMWPLAWSMAACFASRPSRWSDGLEIQRAGLESAIRQGSLPRQIFSHRLLAMLHLDMGETEAAREHQRRLLALAEAADEPRWEARALGGAAEIWARQNRFGPALELGERALASSRRTEGGQSSAELLWFVGNCHAGLSHFDAALDYCERALSWFVENDARSRQALVWSTLGKIHRGRGESRKASECLQAAVELSRDYGDHHFEAVCLGMLGDDHRSNGDHAAARRAWTDALAILGALDALDHPDAAGLRRRLAHRRAVRA